MEDPVVVPTAARGERVVDRAALEDWVAEHGPTCPVSGAPLTMPDGATDPVAGLPTDVALRRDPSWQLAPLVLRLPLSTAADAKPHTAALSAKEGK